MENQGYELEEKLLKEKQIAMTNELEMKWSKNNPLLFVGHNRSKSITPNSIKKDKNIKKKIKINIKNTDICILRNINDLCKKKLKKLNQRVLICK